MDTQRFMAYMTRKKINVQTKINATGKQVIKCNYEDRETVMHWISKHGKGGKHLPQMMTDQAAQLSREFKEEMEKYLDFPLRAIRSFQRDQTKAQKILHWRVISTETKEQAMQLKNHSL